MTNASDLIQVTCPKCSRLVRERVDGCYPKHPNATSDGRCEASEIEMRVLPPLRAR